MATIISLISFEQNYKSVGNFTNLTIKFDAKLRISLKILNIFAINGIISSKNMLKNFKLSHLLFAYSPTKFVYLNI